MIKHLNVKSKSESLVITKCSVKDFAAAIRVSSASADSVQLDTLLAICYAISFLLLMSLLLALASIKSIHQPNKFFRPSTKDVVPAKHNFRAEDVIPVEPTPK